MPTITTLLIANRGEIAARIIRTCRRLGIRSVAVYSEADRNALHVRAADAAIPIGPAPAAQSYLRAEAIIDAALQSGAQAIHPGYGFLSERAHFARQCRAAGLIFVGPTPEAIEQLGDKIAARRLAESLGVPIAPGYAGSDQSLAALSAAAEQIGFPLLIKAGAGGGGRGMRVVPDLATFEELLAAARREALAAFGDDTIFLERLITNARHIEVQILADAHGHAVHLFERECSIQRRHQKIIEEAPAPTLAPTLCAELGSAAVRLVQAAGYVNAGTVEFLVDPDGHAAFLEVNTRLQVEHPITEQITGLDLVELQLAIAAGEPLPFRQEQITRHGHAIELRLCAEDPSTFLPASGTLTALQFPEMPGVRVDSGFASGDSVPSHYDSLLAKLIVHAETRSAALERLHAALDATRIDGITTNLPLLRAIARHPAFIAAATSTDFLQRHTFDLTPAPSPTPTEVLIAAALHDTLELASDPWHSPWRIARSAIPVHYQTPTGEERLSLSADSGGWIAQHHQQTRHVRILRHTPSELIVAFAHTHGEQIAHYDLLRKGSTLQITWRTVQHLLVPTPTPALEIAAVSATTQAHAGLIAPMPGTLTRVLVTEGQHVAIHQPLIVLEAMKMEQTIAAPYAGSVVRIPFAAGTRVQKGALLIELEPHAA